MILIINENSLIPNPTTKKKVNSNKVWKCIETTLENKLHAECYEDVGDYSIWAFSEGTSLEDVSLAISNELRSIGYQTDFIAPDEEDDDLGEEYVDYPTNKFDIEDPKGKNNDFFMTFIVEMDNKNTEKGKVFYSIEIEEVY